MERKIEQIDGFKDLSLKNLQQSIDFWRFMVSKDYISDRFIDDSKNSEKNVQQEDFFPKVSHFYDCSQKSLATIGKALENTNSIFPKLLLVDNNKLAEKIKDSFVISRRLKKKGVLPSIHLVSNYEFYQANRPLDQSFGFNISESEKLIDLVENIPFLNNYSKKQSMSAFELASDWLKVIDRWEWLEESWKILGSPKIQDQQDNFDLGQLHYLFLLKNAMTDKLNPALWHSKQFKLALNDSHTARKKNILSGAVLVLTEIPDPLIIAKVIILARQKMCSLRIFLIKHPLKLNIDKNHKKIDVFNSWEKNFPLIWPEAFNLKNIKNNFTNKTSNFEERRKKLFSNHKEILKEWKNFSDPIPFSCLEVKGLESMTEASIIQINTWISKKLPKIGIVALDRRATRRLIAKLNQKKIEVDDGAGWSLNTSIVSLSVINLTKIISGKITRNDFYYWVNIPLVSRALINNEFLTPNTHKKLIENIKKSKAESNFLKLLPSDLYRVVRKKDSESVADKLISILVKTGVEKELLLDPAGQAVLKVCRKLAVDLSGRNVTSKHFLNIIEWKFSNNNFSMKSANTSIKLMSFQHAIWSLPDAILVVGGTSQNMPNISNSKFVDSAVWEKAAAFLNKRDVELYHLKEFISVLQLKIPVTFVGKSEEHKDVVSWSRWIERIRLMLPDFLNKKIFVKYTVNRENKLTVKPSNNPPIVYLKKYPQSISVSHIKSMIECPYKFFWHSIFGLKKPDYFGENEQHKETGIGLHLLMEYVGNFSENSPNYSTNNFSEKEWFIFFINKLSDMKSKGFISWETALNLRARVGYLSRWCSGFYSKSFPLLVESKVNGKLPGLPILVNGKVDRVENKKNDNNKTFLIDYKSSKVIGIKNELQSAQILIYLWLLKINQITVSDAGYLCVTNKETKWVEVEETQRQEKILEKLCSTFSLLKKGEPIRPIAAKSGHICKNCSVKNVCRKDEWMINKKNW